VSRMSYVKKLMDQTFTEGPNTKYSNTRRIG
jgi:hypothetical protein